MSDETMLQIAILAKNTAALVCFTVLACVFNHWWLVLISPLFFSYLDWKKIKK